MAIAISSATLAGGCGHDADAPRGDAGRRETDAAGAAAAGATTGAELAATLDACALPRPCSWPTSSGNPDEIGSARCIVAELAASRSLSVETRLVADGASTGCETRLALHFFADVGVAYYLWRKRCGDSEEHALRRCQMLGRDAYATCATAIAGPSGPDGFACSVEADWVTSCRDVDDATCG